MGQDIEWDHREVTADREATAGREATAQERE